MADKWLFWYLFEGGRLVLKKTCFDPSWITWNIWDFFRYKPTLRRLVSIFYGNLRPAGAQAVWLLPFMLQMYATQTKNLNSKQ